MINLDDADLDRILDAPVELIPCLPFGVRAFLMLVLDEEPAAFWALEDGLQVVEIADG